MIPADLPGSAAEVRTALGDDFVQDFSDRLERLGVDVIRLEELSTAYSFTVQGRPIIAIKTTGNWFYSNWSLAHELGHLCLRHEGVVPDNPSADTLESAANAFAADLLLPVAELASIDWETPDFPAIADFVWRSGVSVDALGRRLSRLGIGVNPQLGQALAKTTQGFLRRHWASASGDPITERMTDSATRRFPEWLKDAHLNNIAEGTIGKGTLAWMLGVDPSDLEVGNNFDSVEQPTTSDLLSELFG